MKRTIITTLSLLCIATLNSIAQDSNNNKDKSIGNKPTSYISINIGSAIPLSDYGNSNQPMYSETQAGYAKKGVGVSIDFAMPINHSQIGIAANVAHYNNKFNNDAYGADLTLNSTAQSTYYSVGAGDYSINTLMAGIYLTYPIKKFSVDLKILAGYSFCTLPDFSVNSYVINNINTLGNAQTPRVHASAFAYGGNITARYNIYKHICVLGQVNICGMLPTFPANEHISGGFYYQTSWKEQITILGFSGGIGYQL